MKCFLFPTDFTAETDNCCNFVLKDNNENRISVPLKLSSINGNYESTESNTLSITDLQILVHEISAAFSRETNGKITDTSTLNEFLLNQSKDLQTYINKKMNGIPTLKDCLKSKSFIMKTEQDLLSLEKTSSTIKEYKPSNILLDDSLDLDLDFVKQFTVEFKQFRQDLGVTQLEVGQSMRHYLKSDFSQTTICRFESMTLALTNMFDLIPHFRKWISEVYNPSKAITVKNVNAKRESNFISPVILNELVKNDFENAATAANDDNSSETCKIKCKTRKPRIEFSKLQLQKMEGLFQTVQHSQITPHVYRKYANELNLTEKQIRCWITKRRRKDRMDKNRIKYIKFNV